MKDIFKSLLLCITLVLLIKSCASPGMITGGPKDTIPPTLLSAEPTNEQLNFKGQEFTFVFDEKINAEQLKAKLLITPFTDNTFKHIVKKNILTLKFDKPFDDSTTYILNFADGVGDLNERNIVPNFKLAFSTTSFIDSLSISGTVRQIKNNNPSKKYLVSLYASDTLKVLKHKPTYFTYTDTSGYFIFNNLKSSKYRLYAYDDENKNLQLEPKKEALGFISDTIDLKQNIDKLNIYTSLIDASPLEMIRKANNGQYFEARFTKHIDQYELKALDNKSYIPPVSLFDDNTSLRFYNTQPISKDSIGYILTVSDSLQNKIIDTLYITFQGGNRKPQEFKLTTNTKDKSQLIDSIQILLQSNKPLKKVAIDSIIILADKKEIIANINKIGTYHIDNQYNRIYIKIGKLSPFLKNWQETTISHIQNDSINYTDKEKYKDTLKTISQMTFDNYGILVTKGKIISIENDTAEVFKISFTEPKLDQYGSVEGSITTSIKNFILEIIDKEGKTIASIKNPENRYKFSYLSQGTYSFRILIIPEGHTKWDYGNLLTHRPHDRIFYLDKKFDIRPNWQVDKVDISFE